MFRERQQKKGATPVDAKSVGARSGQPSPDYLIELVNVVKNYEIATGVFPALKGISLHVKQGEFVGIIGKSGSGKSTLINMLTGIDRPTSGEIYVNGTPIHTLNEQQMAIWRGKSVGIVFQFFQLLPTLTCVENIMLPMDLCHMYRPSEWRRRALDLLSLVEIREHADKLPSEVSGGQQQRVAIARALANDPPILVADEPTGNLDSVTAESIFQLFERLVEQGKTILVVTHDIDLAKRVNRTLIITDGEVIEEYLARAFPTLPEEAMLWIMREIQRKSYSPGVTILAEGEPAENFYIILGGEVDVLVHGPHEQPVEVAKLAKGQFFGEVELLRGGNNMATIRASHGVGAEVAVLNGAAFTRLMAESEKTREAIMQIVHERVAENVATRGERVQR
jgi:ABC-type lipoprotein export system ATPase subunit